MEEAEKDAMRSFFLFFDEHAGNDDEMLTREEAIAGTTELASMIGYFEAEYNYYM